MVAATCLLVLASAVAISAQSLYCINTNKGVTEGTVFELEPVELHGNADWNVKIPDLPQCVYGVVGVSAKICDYDKAPTGQFTDYSTLFVHRTGQLLGYATVKASVYCVTNYGQQPLLDNQYGLPNLPNQYSHDQLSQVKTLVLKQY